MTKIKLYTEEQMKEAIRMARSSYNLFTTPFIFMYDQDEVLEKLTPIELPSDEEIDVHVEEDFLNATEVHKYSEETQLLMKEMCKAGAKWMRDKIKGGNQ